VYIYENQINSKYYVGKTINFRRRENDHKNTKNNTYFHNAIKKHGWENFKLISLIELNSKEEMNELEMLMIEDLNSFGVKGYNLTPGGDGMYIGFHHKEETKKQISKSMKGKQNCLGNKLSEEHKQNISDGNKKVEHTEEWNRKVGDAHRGKIVTEDTKKKMSKAKKGKSINRIKPGHTAWNKGLTKETDERVAKVAKSLKGHVVSIETKQKIREKRKLQIITEETKKKMSESMKKTLALKKLNIILKP